jgi:AraC-like DNA-binding protein
MREPKVPTALVPRLLSFATARGASAAELARSVGIDDDVDAEEIAVAPATLRALFDAVASATGEPLLGIRLASAADPSSRYAPVELAVRSSATLREALACLARYAPLIHPEITAELLEDGETARWLLTHPRQAGGIGPHADHYAVAVVISRAREVCEAPPPVVAVSFAHARPRDVAPIHRFFGTRSLTFGSETSELVLPARALDARIASHDRRLLVTAKDLADGALARHSPRARTSSLVAAKLPTLLPDRATIRAVAKELAVSVRTLQRRLDEEGTTFLEVLDGVREEIARASLRRSDEPLALLAERLGFSDLATFTRAFKRWTGQPPGMFRRGRDRS